MRRTHTLRRFARGATAALAGSLAAPTLAAAQARPAGDPAGGAATDQVIIGGIGAVVVVTALLVLAWGHRSGRIGLLGRAGDLAARVLHLPAWAALPYALATGAIALTGVGFVWDVALHLSSGRDEGPFANPSHYFLIVGLLGVMAAGWFAIVLPKDEQEIGRSGVQVLRGWRAPVGGVALFAAGSFALLGFPADDVWHRLFGQDVTLWGPTHLMMITGGLLTLMGSAILVEEGRRSQQRARAARPEATPGRTQPGYARAATDVVLAAALLVAFVIAYLQEFQYGTPQFQMLYHPVILALFGTAVLVGVRLRVGRGAALATALAFLVMHGLLTGLNAFAFDVVAPWIPLMVPSALLVELAALLALRRGAYAFGAVAALLTGTLGTLAEWGWTNAVYPLHWPAAMMPPAVLMSVGFALCGATLGAYAATSLGAAGGVRRPLHRGPRALVPPGIALVVAFVALGAMLPTEAPRASASVELREVRGGAQREGIPTVRMDPVQKARDANWLTATAWQGGGLVVAPLRETTPGVFTTDRPVPVHGDWKALVRMQGGREMGSLPIYLPADPGIPVDGVAAPATFERAFVADHVLMQRERKPDVAGWMWPAASAFVALGVLALFTVLGWALLRLRRPELDDDGAPLPVGRPARRRAAGAERGRTTAPVPTPAPGRVAEA